jgi:glutathione gamma-glutamylcysteinyltransferase
VYNDLHSSTKLITESKETDDEFLHSHTCQDNYIDMNLPLPPPLPDPKYSFHRRVLPSSLIQFSSPEGRKLFKEALMDENADAFFPLAEQFLNQSDPAYCGVTSLIMVLNAIGIDPNVRWKGGWRWYGNEDVILNSCCINSERVRRAGILMEEFQSLGVCQGLEIDMKRPISAESDGLTHVYYTADDFRKDVIQMVRNPPRYHMDEGHKLVNDNPTGGFMVVSFSRLALDQTGEGHFSPVAAYHEETDRCLVLDVARFKYAPYWVSINDLYNATKPHDALTKKSRGWFMIYPPREKFRGTKTMNEAKRDANLIPLVSADTQIISENCAIRRK